MATEPLTIGATPVQVTDGTECALISTPAGVSCWWSDSEAQPDKTKRDYIRDRLIVGPPISVWAWTDGRSVELSVTKWQPQ